MSGLQLLLNETLNHEKTHQSILKILFERTDLANRLGLAQHVKKVVTEPEGQSFDLELQSDQRRVLLEIKMWSSLNDRQIKKQKKVLTLNSDCLGGYILLGISWVEWDKRLLTELLGKEIAWISYPHLIGALEGIVSAEADVTELISSYRVGLENQVQRINRLRPFDGEHPQQYYYAWYREIQKHLPDIITRIKTVHNRRESVYIIGDETWHRISGVPSKTWLYQEIVNGVFCIKFHSPEADKHTRSGIRGIIRKAVKTVFPTKYSIVETGRQGEYMTACQIKPDPVFNLDSIPSAVQTFRDIHTALFDILDILRSAERLR